MSALVELFVPSGRLLSANWIRAQDPETVADCLEISHAGFRALQKELSNEESQRLITQVEELQNALDSQKANMRTQSQLRLEAEIRREREEAQIALTSLTSQNKALSDEIGAMEEEKRSDIKIERDRARQEWEAKERALEQEHVASVESVRSNLDGFKNELRKLQEKYSEHQLQASQDNGILREKHQHELTSAVTLARKSQEVNIQNLETIKAELHIEIENLHSRFNSSLAKQRDELNLEHENSLIHVKESYGNSQRDLEEKISIKDNERRLAISELKELMTQEKELLRERLSEDLARERRETAHSLTLKSQALEQQAKLSEQFWNELANQQKELRSLNELLRTANEKHSEEIRNLQESKDTEAQRLQTEKAEVLARYQEFASGFQSSTSIGKIGEDFVQRIHADMSLGLWQDTSKLQEPGYADGLWEMDFPTGKMRILVETKNVSQLHSQKDIAKFATDVDFGIKNGKINGALLISLRARIPNTRHIQLEVSNGIPIIKASREFEDSLPAVSLVQLALNTMANAWPLLLTKRGEEADDALVAAAAFIDDSILKSTQLSKTINDIEKTARNLQKNLVDLKKNRDNVIQGVDQLRVQFPQLNSQLEIEEEEIPDPWTDPRIEDLIACVQEHKREHFQKYPKKLADVRLSEAALEFSCMNPDIDFAKLIKRAKAGVQRGQKRACSSDS